MGFRNKQPLRDRSISWQTLGVRDVWLWPKGKVLLSIDISANTQRGEVRRQLHQFLG
jgi:hypothetical protein